MLKTSSKGDAGQFCAEIELLLCCAKACVDSKTAARVEVVLRQGVDLAYLLRVAGRHGVLPLVYWNVHKVCSVPKAAYHWSQRKGKCSTRIRIQGDDVVRTGRSSRLRRGL